MISYTSIQTYLASIFPNEDIRNYVVKTIADAIHSNEPSKKMYIYKGNGASGKSQFINFLKKVYGETITGYCSSEILTNPNNRSNLITLDGKRIGLIGELEIQEKINSNSLKIALSRDYITNYGKTTYKFPGILIMCCNENPKFNWHEYDNTKLVNVIPFESHFNSTNEQLNLDNLIDEFRTYIQNVYISSMDLTPPKIIQEETMSCIQ